MPDKEENEKEVKEIAEKLAEEVTESTKEVIKEAAEEASKEVEKAGQKAAEEIKSSAEETEVFVIKEGATVVGKTVEEMDKQGILGENALIVEIEQEDEKITPKGDTVLKVGDTITVTSSSGISEKTRDALTK